jgi:predicted ATPase
MIREFWVENFLSIRNRQTLNFETRSKEEEWASATFGDGEKRVNKLAVIYGPNASGKSNMLMAIQNVFELLFYAQGKRTELVRTRKPFALTSEEPTKMFVSFYANHLRYDYEIAYTRDHIISEKMDWYPNGAKAMFYERQYVAQDARVEIKFGSLLGISAKTKEIFLQNTLNNHSVLSVFEKISFENDAKPIADLYFWMAGYMHEVNIMQKSLVGTLMSVEKEPKTKRFFLDMLNKADFNIVDFHTETTKVKLPAGQLNLPGDSKGENVFVEAERTRAFFENAAGNDKFNLSLEEQSEVTKKFLSNLSILYRAIKENHIFLVDEIDSEIHDDLLSYYLNTFVMNSKGSQLIFTTHESSLLIEDILNNHRDFVFLAEKNREGAYSEYTRADEYGLHKNLSLYKSYRNGRLGAIPQLGSPLIYLEDDEEN